jgi:hypothetical protein
MMNNLIGVVLAGSVLLFVPSGGVLIALVILVVNSLVALFSTAEAFFLKLETGE